MSLTGNDPHIKYAASSAKPIEDERQWARCMRAGLTVSIHWDGRAIGAWIKADDVEKYLTPVLGPDVSDENPQETLAP